jgi:hypothetical protein
MNPFALLGRISPAAIETVLGLLCAPPKLGHDVDVPHDSEPPLTSEERFAIRELLIDYHALLRAQQDVYSSAAFPGAADSPAAGNPPEPAAGPPTSELLKNAASYLSMLATGTSTEHPYVNEELIPQLIGRAASFKAVGE